MQPREILIKQTHRFNSVLNGFTKDPTLQQYKVFKKLVKKAVDTELGKKFQFDEILTANFDIALFRKLVPVYTYESIYEEWWKRAKRGDINTCWPGKIKYFALSSGTSKGASKYIPVSKQMLKTIKKTSLKQIVSISGMGLPNKLFGGQVLMVGGSTKLEEKNGRFFGDMSGISMAHAMPDWFYKNYYKPGYSISELTTWKARVDAIVKQAKEWDITVICGMPNWVYYLIEKIIDHYQVKSIHEIWPNFKLYIHGGVYFQPFKADFEKLLKSPIRYAETYMASEGFFGFTTSDSKGNIRLVLNGNVFYEFIPYTNENFDELGILTPKAKTYTINEIHPDTNYALLITNNSGAWRYLIGDVIKFIDIKKATIQIAGRIGKSLSVCGEHVTNTNLLEAFHHMVNTFQIEPGEFTVISNYNEGKGIHHWFIAGNKSLTKLAIATKLDKKLAQLNADYEVARSANLAKPVVHIIPKKSMKQWLTKRGKEGNQNKMPIILNELEIPEWLKFTGISL